VTTAAQQNAMMLASLLGVGENEAAEQLDRTVLLTAEAGWKSSWMLELARVLERTLHVVTEGDRGGCDLEVVIGRVDAPRATRAIFADLDASGLFVGNEAKLLSGSKPHGLYGAAAACAVSAVAIHSAIGAAALPEVRLPMKLNFADLGVPPGALEREIVLDDAFVAGAGAVAHGFLHAARHLVLNGTLTVVDPKTVKEGILNRCLYLEPEDIGSDKAAALVGRAKTDFAGLALVADPRDLREVLKGRTRPPETVFVTVDSRATRRSIQNEFPHTIIDGSTTDVSGVIVHSNSLPTTHACLACIYSHVPEEHSRERAIAAGLGVDLDVVRKGFIDADVARTINEKYPQIDPDAIVGTAFDSLFRQLCAQQALTTPEGRQVLAPFAFVSAWAGVLMAVEMLRRFNGERSANYWRIDPWNLPIARARVMREKLAGCQFCSNPDIDGLIASFGW
jgi:hypothetical protein